MPAVIASHRRTLSQTFKRKWRLAAAGIAAAGTITAGLIAAPLVFADTSTAALWAVGKSTIAPGEAAGLKVVIKDQNQQPIPYRKVTLQRTLGQGWHPIGEGNSYSDGTFAWSVKPGKTSVFRVLFQGGMRDSGQTIESQQVRVTVQDRGAAVVATAKTQIGKPYKYGASGPNSYDCSGYTQWVFGKYNQRLPHSATGQGKYGKSIGKSAAKPGDLLLFGSSGSYHHSAVYVGSGKMIDSAKPGTKITVRNIWSDSYTVRRLV